MKEAGIFFLLEVCLLSMDFQNVLRRYCGAVDVHDMQFSRSGGLGGSTAGCLRDCEVPDCREVGSPSRAEDLLFIAVKVTETWWFGESGQERYGLLIEFIRMVRRATYRKAGRYRTLTFHFRFAGSQPPKQLSFLPVTMIIHSVGPWGLGESFLL